jgi:hypothetical protein
MDDIFVDATFIGNKQERSCLPNIAIISSIFLFFFSPQFVHNVQHYCSLVACAGCGLQLLLWLQGLFI